MNNPLTVHNDLSESLHYNHEGFPVYTHKDELHRYGYRAVCHWHPDLEFIYIVQGTMDYFINGKKVRMETGQGIFVSSRRMHYGFSDEHYECTFIALVISPDIFTQCPWVADYCKEKFGFENEDYILLYPHVPWQKEILDTIPQVHAIIEEGKEPLAVLSSSTDICAKIAAHIQPARTQVLEGRNQKAFLDMTDFIHQHYSEKIDLNAIAQAGAVCRSRCCSLFRQVLRQSPAQYLNEYRITKACELLKNTSLSITQIAGMCGFTTDSYFTSVFGKAMHTTPLQYRKAQ